VKCPLYARAIDIFWGCACERSKTTFLPFFLLLNPLLLNLVRSDWLG
jgi:hypothetical protein